MESKVKMVAFEIEFMDGVRCVVWEKTYSSACARAAYARCEAGAICHRELHVVKGDRWPGFDHLHDEAPVVAFIGHVRKAAEQAERKDGKKVIGDVRIVKSMRGACAKCGQPVRHACPWWTGNPGRDGRPLHDECARKWGLFDE